MFFIVFINLNAKILSVIIEIILALGGSEKYYYVCNLLLRMPEMSQMSFQVHLNCKVLNGSRNLHLTSLKLVKL